MWQTCEHVDTSIQSAFKFSVLFYIVSCSENQGKQLCGFYSNHVSSLI